MILEQGILPGQGIALEQQQVFSLDEQFAARVPSVTAVCRASSAAICCLVNANSTQISMTAVTAASSTLKTADADSDSLISVILSAGTVVASAAGTSGRNRRPMPTRHISSCTARSIRSQDSRAQPTLSLPLLSLPLLTRAHIAFSAGPAAGMSVVFIGDMAVGFGDTAVRYAGDISVRWYIAESLSVEPGHRTVVVVWQA